MPAKRTHAQSHQRPSKRQRTIVVNIGQVNEDDRLNDAQRSAQQPSSSALSTRDTGPTAVLSLVKLSMNRFAESLLKLEQNDSAQSRVRSTLANLPTHLVQPLFLFLQSSFPGRLSHEYITKYFLRGDHIFFSEDMTGVLNRTIVEIRKHRDFASGLKRLELRGQINLKDVTVAATISQLPALVELVLRGCTKVGSQTVEAAAESCHELETINLNYTIAGHAALAKLITSCKKLHSVKLAGLTAVTDTHVQQILQDAAGRLRRLKVRQTRLSGASSSVISNALSSATISLDISFTSLVLTELPPSLEKLSLMATTIPLGSLPRLFQPLTKLRKLSLALLGHHTPNLYDEHLIRLLPALAACSDLLELNLAGNVKLGVNNAGGIRRLLEVLGSRLEVLNLSGIKRLRWYDLEPFKDMAEPPRLKTFSLMNTSLDDHAAPCIVACQSLQHLNLSGSGFTTEGVGMIVDACPHLSELDLTGCRGVGVQERRRFFEAWAKRKYSVSN